MWLEVHGDGDGMAFVWSTIMRTSCDLTPSYILVKFRGQRPDLTPVGSFMQMKKRLS